MRGSARSWRSLTVVVTPVFPSYPLILDAVAGGVYDRPVRAMDVPGGGAAQLACGAAARAWTAARC